MEAGGYLQTQGSAAESYMQFQNVRRCLHVCAGKIEPYQGTFQSPFLISQLSLAVLAQT